MDEQEAPKRRGRPRLPDGERKRHTMTFRMRDELRTVYAARAEKNGGSISEEIEKSLERDLSLSDIVLKQKDIIDTLSLSADRQSKQIDTYKEQIVLYKDMVSRFNNFSDNVASINYYLMKKMLEANINVLNAMREGKDLASQFGSIENVEAFIAEVKAFLDNTPEPKPTDALLELQNNS